MQYFVGSKLFCKKNQLKGIGWVVLGIWDWALRESSDHQRRMCIAEVVSMEEMWNIQDTRHVSKWAVRR